MLTLIQLLTFKDHPTITENNVPMKIVKVYIKFLGEYYSRVKTRAN